VLFKTTIRRLAVLWTVIPFVLLFSSFAFAKGFNVTEFTAHVFVNPDEAYLRGIVDLSASFPDIPNRPAMLALHDSLKPSRIWLHKEGKWEPLKFKKLKRLLIALPSLGAGNHRLKILFQGHLPKLDAKLTQTTSGSQIQGTVKTAMSPTFGQLFAQECWHPWIPALGSPKSVRKARLSVSLPDAYKVVTNGKLLRQSVKLGVNKTTWELDEGIRLGGFNLFYGKNHQLFSTNVNGKFIGTFIPSSASNLAPLITSLTGKIIQHHSRCLNVQYPYQQQLVVFSSLFPSRWGYGKHSGTLVISDDYLKVMAKRSGKERQRKALSFLAHELGHHWFGILISVADFMAFEEGMAELLAGLAAEKIAGPEAYNTWKDGLIKELQQFFANGGQDFPLKDDLAKYVINPDLDPNIFKHAKDLQITKFPLYMLKARKILGDRNFFITLQNFSNKLVGKRANSWTDFVSALPNDTTAEKKAEITRLFHVRHESFESLMGFLDK